MKKLYLLLFILVFLGAGCCVQNEKERKTTESTPRKDITETVNKLFVYTDHLKWEKLQNEVFASEVLLDVTSLGAEKADTMLSQAICEMWNEGLKDLDAVHHQAGNYIITIENNEADVFAYAIATHYKKNSDNDKVVTEFVGSYDLHLIKTEAGWRIDKFKYNLKYID